MERPCKRDGGLLLPISEDLKGWELINVVHEGKLVMGI